MILNQATSPSGHKKRLHSNESIGTVMPIIIQFKIKAMKILSRKLKQEDLSKEIERTKILTDKY